MLVWADMPCVYMLRRTAIWHVRQWKVIPEIVEISTF